MSLRNGAAVPLSSHGADVPIARGMVQNPTDWAPALLSQRGLPIAKGGPSSPNAGISVSSQTR